MNIKVLLDCELNEEELNKSGLSVSDYLDSLEVCDYGEIGYGICLYNRKEIDKARNNEIESILIDCKIIKTYIKNKKKCNKWFDNEGKFKISDDMANELMDNSDEDFINFIENEYIKYKADSDIVKAHYYLITYK